ncbi:MAG: 5-histidylcysteine sulfoxide synthase [Pseudohongiella sp.]|nr:5-histidylcysteine sulfoxide synthase [Pseudohongiella sp.]
MKNSQVLNEILNASDLLVNKTCVLVGDEPSKKREEIRQYFHRTFTLYEHLFECLANDQAFYEAANTLRHPLIFYYGHTATFFINKLHVAKLIPQRLNPKIESMFAIGVDEMSWDDLNEKNYDWPSPIEVREYRNQVRDIVDNFIQTTAIDLPVAWEDPLWIVMMGIEHERIHLETSSVLIRQLPIEFVKPHFLFLECPGHGSAPANILLPVKGKNIKQGKVKKESVYGWDNEYGELETNVKDFKASQYLVSNKEYLGFVEDSGYQTERFWTEEGWAWASHAKAIHPPFWAGKKGCYSYRTMTRIIEMPWDWPVDVNYLEANAFCQWKSEKTGRKIRLPTEAQWYCLREEIADDQPDWESAPGNINLEHWASACPVTKFPTQCANGSVFYDIIGNVWQWTETPIDGLPGFEAHNIYDDFSIPTFDGKHNLIKGGSFFSTGNSALKSSRYAFRRHFFQHAGFRYVESEEAVIAINNQYETDEQVSQYIEFHFGDEYHSVANYAKACGDLCLEYFATKAKGSEAKRALDLGCAIGRTSFELATVFDYVDGIDFSTRFVSVATQLKETGAQRYKIRAEGDLFDFKEARLADLQLDEAAQKCNFWQGDACNLADKYANYNLIFAGNLIDRLYDPRFFLSTIHERLADNGLLILTSPYTWIEEFTVSEKWLGGYKRDGENFSTLDGLKEVLASNFELADKPRDVPFVIRETARKFQHSIAQMTVWQRKPR